ncbi:hypothetical protein KCU92_g9853, partial [Aureobasidium melanogenum]
MSHGGPLTLMQKRMMALPATTAGPHNTPLLLAVYDHSSSVSTSSQHATTDQEACTSFDNIEMQDISAAASTASPPANYSRSRPRPRFSAAAKPFVPPGASATATIPTASTTSLERLPPHRAMAPLRHLFPVPVLIRSWALTLAMDVPTQLNAVPFIVLKQARQLIASPVRHAGPHSKLGPHARRTNAPTEPNTPSAVQDEIDLQQTKTEAPPVRRET